MRIMNKVVLLLVSLLFLIPLVHAEQGGDLNLNNKASLVSRDGYKLTLGTEGDDDFQIVQNGVVTLSINGATGVPTFASAPAAASINGNPALIKVSGTTEISFTDDKATFSGASFKFVPGATSLLFRNNADSASNLSIADAGLVTVGVGNLALTVGNLTFGAASAKILPGVTSLLFRNNADSASNLSIADAGLVTVGVGNLTLTAGNLTFGAASAKVVPGVTSLLFRNNGDSATNLSITDAGLVTVGVGNLTLTAGNLTFGAASAKVVPGATSLLFRNNADSASNLAITDAGISTVRNTIVFSADTNAAIATDATTKSIRIGGGASDAPSSGGVIAAYGNTHGSFPGNVRFFTGTASGASIQFTMGHSSGTFNITSSTAATNLSITDGGAASIRSTFTSSATADLGWSVVNVANQACNTTCTSACVVGIDTLGTGGFLSCATATADSCICAGAS